MVIHHDLRLRVVIHGIDGEIAAHCVFFLRAPDVVAQHPPGGVHGVFHARQFAFAGLFVTRHLFGSGVVQVGTEGGHFDDLVFAAPAKHHVHDAKTPPDQKGAAKQALDLLRCGIGGHIEVFGSQTDQQVAYCTPHHIGLKPRSVQGANHIQRAFIHQRWVDAMGLNGHVNPLAKLGFFAC